MAIGRNSLGNGFVFNVINSSKDQEHYFGSATKSMNVSCLGSLTGSTDIVFTSGSVTSSLNDAYRWVLLDIKSHPLSGNKIYATGMAFTGASPSNPVKSLDQSQWVTIMSTDSGNTWAIIDQTGSDAGGSNGRKSVGYSIMFHPSNGNVIVAGVVNARGGTNIGTGQMVIRSSSNDSAWTNLYTTSSALAANDYFPNRYDIGASPRGKLLTHPVSSSIFYYVFSHPEDAGGIRVLTSSLAGNSGTWFIGGVAATGTLVRPYVTDAIFSGTKLIICGGDWQSSANLSRTSWIMTGSAFGTGSFLTVYSSGTAFSNSDFRCLTLDGEGKIWVVGQQSPGGLAILTSSNGDINTWTFSRAVASLSGNWLCSSIIKDNNNNLWIAANAVSSSLLMYKPSEAYDTWTHAWKRDYTSRTSTYRMTQDVKYNNIYLLTTSASLANVEKFSPLCVIHQGSSSFYPTQPMEIVMGLRIKDSVRAVEFSDPTQLKSFFGLTSREVLSLSPTAFSFSFSGSFVSASNSIAVRSMTGSYFEIKSFGKVSASSDKSSSFNTGYLPSAPTQVGLFRVRLTQSTNLPYGSFSNFNFSCAQPMTSEGVQFFKDVENQKLSFTNLKVGFIKKIDE